MLKQHKVSKLKRDEGEEEIGGAGGSDKMYKIGCEKRRESIDTKETDGCLRCSSIVNRDTVEQGWCRFEKARAVNEMKKRKTRRKGKRKEKGQTQKKSVCSYLIFTFMAF